jgi:nucleotide-binding universal stress UspA family protein
MGLKTILVHLEAGQPNTTLLRVAADIAERFGAAAIGIAACQPTLAVYNSAYLAGDLIAREQQEMEERLGEAEAEFNQVFKGPNLNLGWRAATTFGALHEFIAEEVRCADLIITGTTRSSVFQGWTRHANSGALVVLAGRPMLVVPASTDTLKLDHALVAWRDTPETRRAVTDALPFLQQAAHVTVVEISAEKEDARRRTEDVAAWLQRHRVRADSAAHAAAGDDASRLRSIARDLGADLIVAGAYGHSRLQEWAFGGVTRDLLLGAERCALLSH